jgi:hypothetical protein
MARLQKLLRPFKYVAVAVLVIALILIISYRYTYVSLTPEYSGINFKEMQIGSISLELPDFFALELPFMPIFITYPDYQITIIENYYSDITDNDGNKKTIEERCYGPAYNVLNQENDSDLSELTKYRTVMFTPREFEPAPNDKLIPTGRYRAVFFLDSGCVKIIDDVKGYEHPDDKKMIFKKRVRDFLKFYMLQTDNEIFSKGFKTFLGFIRQNNEFKIDAYFSLTSDISQRITDSAVRYQIRFVNSENFFHGHPSEDIGFLDRLNSYTKTRYNTKSIMDFRWTNKQGDFQFSSLYSGREQISMPVSIKGHPVELSINAIANKKSDSKEGFFDCIMVYMTIGYDNQLSNPDYNVVYGYWVKAKESARIK